MKRKFLYLIFIILILTNLAFCKSSQESFNEKLIGFWGDYFPIPDAVYGYIFLENGICIYHDMHQKENLEKMFIGVIGKWKVDNGNILFYPEKDVFYKKKNPGLNDLFSVEVKKSDWYLIGKTESFQKEGKNNEKYIPNSIELNIIINGLITSKRHRYWQINNKSNLNNSEKDILIKEFVKFLD
jgi:hypothetical protein